MRKYGIHCRVVFGTGAMGALEPAILKNRLLSPAIFGHSSTVGKMRVLNKNLINTQHPQGHSMYIKAI